MHETESPRPFHFRALLLVEKAQPTQDRFTPSVENPNFSGWWIGFLVLMHKKHDLCEWNYGFIPALGTVIGRH